MLRVFLLAALLISCGDYEPVRAIYFDGGPYTISQEMVNYVIEQVEVQVGHYYERPDIEQLTYDHGLTVYVSRGTSDDNRGMFWYHRNRIDIKPFHDDPMQLCMEIYYSLSHELMHFVGYYMGYSIEDGVAHEIPYLFFRWANVHNEPLEDTAEFFLFFNIKDRCKDFTKS